MGLFDFLFGGKSAEPSGTKDEVDSKYYADTYKELTRFINFAKKIKPLTGSVYGLYISYHAPERESGVYTSRIYVSMGFCDFNEITFAKHECKPSSNLRQLMIPFYYREISKKAELSKNDWPYGIDEYDFERVLCGTFGTSEELFVELIPDEHLDDVFTFKVSGGVDSRNALQVYNTVNNLLKSQFPELQITKNHATPYSMGITIQI